MKALSLKQPWLYAITDLDKRIENRTWKPPSWIVGKRIALHASKKSDTLAAYGVFCRIAGLAIPLAHLERGAIVATARIVGYLDEHGRGNVPIPCMGHLVDDKWFFGPYGWILEDVRKIAPIKCRGSLGLWDVPEQLENEVTR